MLLQAKKEFAICGGLQPEDVFFYYTTTGWMMWNFLVSGLSVGSTLVLYDGSPLRDPSYLWKLVDDLSITIFGTSAKYIDHLSVLLVVMSCCIILKYGAQKGYRPREHHDLSTLRHIYSTGSPLAPPLFDYVYRHIRKDVLLGSITGRSLASRPVDRMLIIVKVARIYVLYSPACAQHCQYIEAKFNVACWEWPLKASRRTERSVHLMNLENLFA